MSNDVGLNTADDIVDWERPLARLVVATPGYTAYEVTPWAKNTKYMEVNKYS